MIKKLSLLCIVICLTSLVTSCKRWHTKEIVEGIYETREIITNGDFILCKVKVQFIELSKDNYDVSKGIDVLDDLASPRDNHKYYQVKLSIQKNDEDEVYYPLLFLGGNAIGGNPNEYRFTFEYVFDEVVYTVNLLLKVINLPSSISLRMDSLGPYDIDWFRMWEVK
ncbi:hypothetical protein [Paracholeplasma manati]|uniref:Uncharacterized protein n=1 Tax=Paracholeplasma manati TaxID=591373 RepID=A0ABT2Y435_9MOLU|nr:hypothetical protein [Paracholeplasma manati]MCV2231242.1 hypothetical protein [Paracholeplasma manati]MDG0888315.1 hypothetical protein [Paracholeplasma manati]